MNTPTPPTSSHFSTIYHIATLITAFFLIAPPALTQEATFQGLGDLPGGDIASAAYGVSPDGAIVVGKSSSSDSGPLPFGEAFRLENGVIEGLGDLSGGEYNSLARDISNDGSVIVGSSSSENGFEEAFRWEDGAMEGLGDLPGGDFFFSSAYAMSTDGSVVAGVGSGKVPEGFRWENGVMEGIGVLPEGVGSSAFSVSADGSIVIGACVTDGNPETFSQEAIRWEDGEMQSLGILSEDGSFSVANGISADGSVIVGQSDSEIGAEAFRWADGQMEGLGVLGEASLSSSQTSAYTRRKGAVVIGRIPSEKSSEDNVLVSLSQALAASEDGAVVVGWSTSADVPSGEAFIWTQDSGMQSLKEVLEEDHNLDLTGWTLTAATDITPDGSIIVGEGINPDDHTEAWRAFLGKPVADEATPESLTNVLSAANPNPASGTTSFTVSVERGQNVSVEIFDVMGRRVQAMYEGALAAGMSESLTLDASTLPVGVYVVRATGEDFTRTRRLTVVR